MLCQNIEGTEELVNAILDGQHPVLLLQRRVFQEFPQPKGDCKYSPLIGVAIPLRDLSLARVICHILLHLCFEVVEGFYAITFPGLCLLVNICVKRSANNGRTGI